MVCAGVLVLAGVVVVATMGAVVGGSTTDELVLGAFVVVVDVVETAELVVPVVEVIREVVRIEDDAVSVTFLAANGTAVHFLPLIVVRKAPEGKLAFVAMAIARRYSPRTREAM